MSEKYTFYSQDVSACNEMEAWRSMINCIVNFVTASTHLATTLERNHANKGKQPQQLPKLTEELNPADNNGTNYVKESDKPSEVPQTPSKCLTSSIESDVARSNTKLIEDLPKPPEDVCLTDFSYFINAIKGNDKADFFSTNSESTTAALPYTEEPQGATRDVSQPGTFLVTQDQGDCSTLEYENNLGDDEGVDVHHNTPQEDDEDKSKSTSIKDKENSVKEDIKKPSEDSCFFQDYTDSDLSIDSENLASAYDAESLGAENTSNPSEINEEDKATKNNQELKSEELIEVSNSKENDSNKFPKEKENEDKEVNRDEQEDHDGKHESQSEEQQSENETENLGNEDERGSEDKDEVNQTDPKKSEEIQTNSTNRYNSTVKALITTSPDLQNPIKDNLKAKKLTKQRSMSKEQIKSSEKMAPKNLIELKERLNSMKNRPNAVAGSTKKESLTDEKQIADLKHRLKCYQQQTLKKNNSQTQPGPTLRGPRSSVIIMKKEIIAEDNSVKKPVVKKYPKVTKRYDSIESVVKRIINGTQKADSGSSPNILENNERPSGDKENVKKRPRTNPNTQQKQEESQKALKDRSRSRSISKSLVGSLTSQKDLKKEVSATTKLINPKSKNVLKNTPANPPEHSVSKPRVPIKAIKNLKATKEEPKKKQLKKATEEKKVVQANNANAVKASPRPKSAS